MSRPDITRTDITRVILVADIASPLDPDAIESAAIPGFDGEVVVAPLPGTPGQPRLVGGNHEVFDPAYALGASGLLGLDAAVVGFGRSGPPALAAGVAGRAGAVVLVDGLGGPFVTPGEQIAATIETMRAILDDLQSHGPAGPGQPDPRLVHGPAPHGDRKTTEQMLAACTAPVLVVETPDSTVSSDVADGIASGQTTVEHVASADLAAVGEVVGRWLVSS